MKLLTENKTLTVASAKSGMSEKTARKYRNSGRLPEECKKEHTWATRKDPFEDVYVEIEEFLGHDEKKEARSLVSFFKRGLRLLSHAALYFKKIYPLWKYFNIVMC